MYTLNELFLAIVVAFNAGTVLKTLIDACCYRRGVTHGWRVANGDDDKELEGAREIIVTDCESQS